MNTWLVHIALLASTLLFLAVGAPLAWWARRHRRRSPITFTLRHLPGERARRQLADIDEKFGDQTTVLVATGPMVIALALSRHVDLTNLHLTAYDLMLLLTGIGVIVTLAVRMRRLARARRQLADGLYAELATAQELQPLLAKGYAVVHNVQGDGFDIDHVVIGPACVWTVESKSRRKPTTGGKHAARVTYDGKTLQFPDWRETRPLEQARAQARWLADRLHQRNGSPVEVRPVLSLLGWYVERTGTSDVAVLSARGIGQSRLFDVPGKTPLDHSARTRIVAALEERLGSHDGEVGE